MKKFMMHVLIEKFEKIRHYGILTNRNRKSKLKGFKEILGVAINKTKEKRVGKSC